jgi:hypothetical protein
MRIRRKRFRNLALFDLLVLFSRVCWYNTCILSREDIAFMYLEQLPFEPYPFQKEAILDWFSSEQGTLVCAPTGMQSANKYFFCIPISLLVRLILRHIAPEFLLAFFRLFHQFCQRQCAARQDRPDYAPIVATGMVVFAIKTILLSMKAIFDFPVLQNESLILFGRSDIRIKAADIEMGFHHRLLASSPNRFFQDDHRLTVGNFQLFSYILRRPFPHPETTSFWNPLFLRGKTWSGF